MPISQRENLTLDIVSNKLNMGQNEALELLELLHNEHVVRYKYTFQCNKCGELDTIFEDERMTKKECNICGCSISVETLLQGARIRYVLDKNDFIEFMEEEYPKELQAAQDGKRPMNRNVESIEVRDSINEVIRQMEETPKYKIFISHAALDASYVNAFVSFLETMGLSREQVFCSSIDGYGIPWGDNIYEYLSSEFKSKNNELLVVFMLSNNFYTSAACLNEMGAAWILKKEYRSILLPGFEYAAIKGAIDPSRIAIKLDGADIRSRLNDVKEQLSRMFELRQLDTYQWDRIRQEFMDKIEEIKKRQGTT